MSTLPMRSGDDLRAAGRSLATPFALAMPDGSQFEFQQPFRLLPGKRVAGMALWNGKTVFAKIFFADAAIRHGEREYAGLQALANAGLPTPAVLATFRLAGNVFVILSEFLAASPAVDGQQVQDGDFTSVVDVVRLVGRLHQAGLVQEDLHFDNFLVHAGRLLLIDGDGIRPAKDEPARQANLALLLSQLPPLPDGSLAQLLAAYGRPAAPSTLATGVAAARRQRLNHYLEKTTRDCT
ncbi:MAG TPA: RIO1 family regulatory kinase/ATPase, partial [Azonexus sp.]